MWGKNIRGCLGIGRLQDQYFPWRVRLRRAGLRVHSRQGPGNGSPSQVPAAPSCPAASGEARRDEEPERVPGSAGSRPSAPSRGLLSERPGRGFPSLGARRSLVRGCPGACGAGKQRHASTSERSRPGAEGPREGEI